MSPPNGSSIHRPVAAGAGSRFANIASGAKPASRAESVLPDRKRLIVGLRFLILGTVVLLSTIASENPSWEFWFVATIYLVSNFIYAIEAIENFLSERTSRWIFLFDVTLVTVLFGLSSSPTNDFWIPYFLTILVAAMAAEFKIAVSAAVVSAAVYGFVIHRSSPDGASFFTATFFLHTTLFFVTALFVGTLADGARRERARRGGLNEALAISSRFADLFDLKLLIDLSRDPRGLARYVLDISQELFFDDAGSLMLKDESSGELRVAVARGMDPVEGRSDPDGIAAFICKTGAPLRLVGPPASDPRFSHLKSRPEIRSSISVPIKHKDETFGVLNFNRQNPNLPDFTDADLQLAATFAVNVGIALSNAKVYRDLDAEKLKALDELERMRETQNEAIRTEKQTTLESVVTNIARNLNDPLTGVLGSAELALEKIEDSHDARQCIVDLVADAERARAMVAELESMHRRQLPARVPTDIVKLLDDVLFNSEIEFQHNGITLITDYAPGLHLAAIDPQMIRRVFAHLVENAINAMRSRADGVRKLAVAINRVSGEIHVSFTDSGSGVRLDHLHSIFQPFFTTSATGASTGLGLATAQRLVRDNGGRIRGISDGTEGATFVVTLPVAAGNRPRWGVDGKRTEQFGWALPLSEHAAVEGAAAGAANSRVLLVDSDLSVGRIVREALAGEYRVTCANSAELALKIISESLSSPEDAVVAIILDVGLAGGGFQLYETLANRHPDLANRVVLAAGATPEATVTSQISKLDCPFLTKPFHLADLRMAVRTATARMEI